MNSQRSSCSFNECPKMLDSSNVEFLLSPKNFYVPNLAFDFAKRIQNLVQLYICLNYSEIKVGLWHGVTWNKYLNLILVTNIKIKPCFSNNNMFKPHWNLFGGCWKMKKLFGLDDIVLYYINSIKRAQTYGDKKVISLLWFVFHQITAIH